MRHVLMRALVVMTLGIAMAFAVQGTAQGQTRATHYHTQFLAATPNNGMAETCMPARRILLAAGNYSWGHFFGGEHVTLDSSIILAAGWYTWGDCLDPETDFYVLRSSLNPDDPDLATARIQARWDFDGANRNITWGSFLDP